ncbi:hypothetical protein Tco_1289650 [Tanacetum coccineum]
MAVARFSTVRATASNDRELPNTASKPQKISRTARRTNIVPVVPSNDDIPSLDSGTENGSFTKRVPVNSPSPTSSEIKESGATKYRQNVQKVYNDLTEMLDRSSVNSPFWRQIEPLFSFPSDTDICYLKQQGSIQSVVPTTKPDVDSAGDIPLSQTLLSALIPEEGDDNENDGTESNGYGSAFEDETYIKSNGFMEFSGVGNFYGYGKKPAHGFHNEPVCSVSDYHTMSMDNRLLLELESGLCPKLMVGALFSNTLVGLGHGSKRKWSAGTKLAKKEALANVKQTLERCQEFETTGNSFKDNVEDEPPLHFSHLEIPEMDVLGDAFSEKSQELGSWLNIIDDIILQDDEFMGLEIPMDDLSDIKMTV